MLYTVSIKKFGSLVFGNISAFMFYLAKLKNKVSFEISLFTPLDFQN